MSLQGTAYQGMSGPKGVKKGSTEGIGDHFGTRVKPEQNEEGTCTGAAGVGCQESKQSEVGILTWDGLQRLPELKQHEEDIYAGKRPGARCQTQVGIGGRPRVGIN